MVDKSFVLNNFPAQSRGVEIGVWKGEYSKVIADRISPTALYLCDPWLFTPQHPDRWYGGTQATSQQDMDNIYGNVVDMFADNPNVHVIRDVGANLLNYIQAGTLDWTYIDGDHSYEAVLQDLIISYELVKPEGFITGDDFDNGNDIHKAVEEFVNKYTDQIESAIVQSRQFIIKLNKL